MKYFTQSAEDLTANINTAKEIFIRTMVRERIITQKQADRILEEYAIVISPPDFFGKIISKISGQKEDYQFRVVRTVDGYRMQPQPEQTPPSDKKPSKIVSLFSSNKEPTTDKKE